MPVVHRFGPYRFLFFSHENQEINEPPHVHVIAGDRHAIFWLKPVSLRESWGYTPREIARIRAIVMTQQHALLRHRDEFFGPPT